MERTDVSVLNPKPNVRTIEIDVCIPDARAGDANRPAPEPGEVAADWEVEKDNQYKARVEAAGSEFVPFVVEAGGRFGVRARKFFKFLIHAVSQQTDMPKSLLSSKWRQKIAVNLKRVRIQQQRLQAVRMGVIPGAAAEGEEEDPVEVEDFGYMRA
jgi:hypothetical protein